MKTIKILYKIRIILLGLLWSLNGISSLAAQEITPADSLTMQSDSLRADSLITDSIQEVNQKNWNALMQPADTADLSQKSDSIAALQKNTRFIPDPQRALWLSLVMPGAGQIYNRKYWKLPIVYGGFLGCVYALSWNGQMYKDYSQAYLDIMDDDPNTKSYEAMLPINYDITGREDRFKEIFKNKKNYYRKYRDMSVFCMVGVYLLSVIDAYVDAELSSFDISKDLGMRIEPAVINTNNISNKNTAVGVQCRFNF